MNFVLERFWGSSVNGTSLAMLANDVLSLIDCYMYFIDLELIRK